MDFEIEFELWVMVGVYKKLNKSLEVTHVFNSIKGL